MAVHLACQSLRSGESDLALAGGVNVILEPHITIAYSQARMMAPDGRCKFGDARRDGYVRSEGAGIVVLKPLSRALADGDPHLRGDPRQRRQQRRRSSGLLVAPSQSARRLLRQAYADAGVAPARVDYVEAHGTGTRAGDPVELGALGAVLGEARGRRGRCLRRLGQDQHRPHRRRRRHRRADQGGALALEHRAIPPSLHFTSRIRAIPWDAAAAADRA